MLWYLLMEDKGFLWVFFEAQDYNIRQTQTFAQAKCISSISRWDPRRIRPTLGVWAIEKKTCFQRYAALRCSACLKGSTYNHFYIHKDYTAMFFLKLFFSCTFSKCSPKVRIWHWEFWTHQWKQRKHQSISPVRSIGMEFQI